MFLEKLPRHRQAGFTMVESMVALFIFTVGLLGVAGMQVTNQQSVHEAIQRTEAATLAHSMMERIRLNVGANAVAIYHQAVVGAEEPNPPGTDCIDTFCNQQQMATYDLSVWGQELRGLNARSGLVAPTGCITIGAGNFVTVSVVWRGSRRSNENGNVICGADREEYKGTSGEAGFRRTLQFTTLLAR